MLGMISCKEAALLSEKNEEGKLSFGEKVKLRVHVMICKMCQVVQQQNKFVIDHSKHTEQNLQEKLTVQEKEEIAKKVFKDRDSANS